MLWLYVLAAIAVLIALLLFSPVNITLKYNRDFSVKISYLFIVIRPFPPKHREKPKMKITKTKKDSQKDENSFSKLVKAKGLSGAIADMTESLKIMVSKFLKLFRHVSVRKLSLDIGVTGEDAAKTAVNYGCVCGVIYPALGFLSSVMIFYKPKLNIYCDYDSDFPRIEGKAIISVKSFFVVKAALSALTVLLKTKIKSSMAAMQNEKAKKNISAGGISNGRK